MKDNATFIEFATFFFIIAFSVTMTKMQWDHTDNITQARIDQELKILNDADELIAWNDRVTRIQSVRAINHDGDPNTNTIDITLDSSGSLGDYTSCTWIPNSLRDNDCSVDLTLIAGEYSYCLLYTSDAADE